MSARDDSAGLALDAGADDFVVKPFAITWLLNLVAEHLRRVHTRQ
jgi:DNA-binding response OmpR family regulator